MWREHLLVHGSPRKPTCEYVLPVHAAWPPPGMFEEIFAAFDKLCFVGHTHLPGIFSAGPVFVAQKDIDGVFAYRGEKLLINVGSVGQPRDQNWRACYLTGDGESFQFHRIEYPVEITQRKIRDNTQLDDRLADRLATGE
jgi:diadenosine tetraphosphatase ApaH/serine/threonine PP2A family protein phosphatase